MWAACFDAPALHLVQRPLHRAASPCRRRARLGPDVAGGAAGDLDQGRLGAQEALVVGVEDGHQRDLGQVQAFAQEVDADQDVELALAQVLQDLDALERVDVGVQVAHAQALGGQESRRVLGGALGQGRDQDALVRLATRSYARMRSSSWPSVGRMSALGVDEAGRADDLLDDLAPGALELVGAGRGRDVTRSAPPAPRTRRT